MIGFQLAPTLKRRAVDVKEVNAQRDLLPLLEQSLSLSLPPAFSLSLSLSLSSCLSFPLFLLSLSFSLSCPPSNSLSLSPPNFPSLKEWLCGWESKQTLVMLNVMNSLPSIFS